MAKKSGLPGNKFLRLLDVGNNLFHRLPGAAGESRQREGSAHQLEEISTVEWLHPFRRVIGKFAVQKFAELLRARHFIETPPIARPARRPQPFPHRCEVESDILPAIAASSVAHAAIGELRDVNVVLRDQLARPSAGWLVDCHAMSNTCVGADGRTAPGSRWQSRHHFM